jgi:RES domain-containing protein
MIVYRIVKNADRVSDLSGMGAYRDGGRWNSERTYALYTSENSSLALLENLVYFDEEDAPRKLYIMFIELKVAPQLIYILPNEEYPDDWMHAASLKSKLLGDRLMNEKEYLGFKVKSRINSFEYNYILNPLFHGYYDMVKVISVEELIVDPRLT